MTLPIRFSNKDEAFEEARKEKGSLVIETNNDFYLYHTDYDMDEIESTFSVLINDGIIGKAYYHYFA